MIGPRHARVQRLRQLARRRRARSEHQAFVLDSPMLLESALAAKVPVQEVFAAPDADEQLVSQAEAAGARVYHVAEDVLGKATRTVTPQPLAAVASFHDVPLSAALGTMAQSALTLVLIGVNDPGNLGTLARSAQAVGAGALICCDDTVDPYNPKVVRASAGALFSLAVVRRAVGRQALTTLRSAGASCVGTVVRDGVPYDQVDLTRPVALVLGSEAHGLAEDTQGLLDELVTIPMVGSAESLNVAMAGTVIAFEASRQRRVAAGSAN